MLVSDDSAHGNQIRSADGSFLSREDDVSSAVKGRVDVLDNDLRARHELGRQFALVRVVRADGDDGGIRSDPFVFEDGLLRCGCTYDQPCCGY